MSMVSYAEHRSSEIGPHGHLPLHWKPGLVKRFYVVSLGKMVTSSEVVETRGTRPYLRSANIQDGRLDISDIKTMWFSEAEQSALNLKKGDLLVCEGGDAGRCAILDRDLEEFGFQNSVNRVRSVGGCGGSAKYLNYWLKFLKQAGWIEVICNRSTIAHLTAGKLGSIELPHPPPDEQRAIATFLDRETGRIDELIAEQERLVGLLDEKRQSVISHAVTKGLDSSVAMKDSGCAWIGSMPIQWAVSRIGYYAAVKNGCTPDRDNPSYWIDGQIAWVSSGEVNQYVVLDASEYITQAALDESNLRIIPSGAVLVGLIGQGKTRGMAALLGIPTNYQSECSGRHSMVPAVFQLSALFTASCLRVSA